MTLCPSIQSPSYTINITACVFPSAFVNTAKCHHVCWHYKTCPVFPSYCSSENHNTSVLHIFILCIRVDVLKVVKWRPNKIWNTTGGLVSECVCWKHISSIQVALIPYSFHFWLNSAWKWPIIHLYPALWTVPDPWWWMRKQKSVIREWRQYVKNIWRTDKN